MSKDKVIPFEKLGDNTADPLTELLRSGARKLITDAVEVELQQLLSQYASLKNERGHQRKRHRNRIFFLRTFRAIMDPIKTTTDEDSDDRTQDRRRSGKVQASLAGAHQGPEEKWFKPGGILSPT